MPRKLFDGPLGQWLRKYKVIRRLALAVGVAFLIYFMGLKSGWWGEKKDPKAESHITAPAEDLAVLVKPVADILKDSPSDGKQLGSLFLAFADCLEADDENIISTTSQVAAAHSRSGRLLFGDELKGKHPGLGKAVDQAIMAHVGDGDLPLTEARRKKTVEIFRALAWATDQH